MKLIRLTDDRYILDLGGDATARMVDEVAQAWDDWWTSTSTIPKVMTIGGHTEPVEYEDRRESPVLQDRMKAIEEAIIVLAQAIGHEESK